MPELTEDCVLMATALGNMTETRHKVSQQYNYCIFITYLSEPIGNVSNILFFPSSMSFLISKHMRACAHAHETHISTTAND